MGAVPGGSEEDVGLRDATYFVELAGEEENFVPLACMLNIALAGL